MIWRWTFVWCSECIDDIVILGRRWLAHTDERPVCTYCSIRKVLERLREDSL